MILYPTSILFRATRAIELAAIDLLAGRPLSRANSVDMKVFEDIVQLDQWAEIEDSFQKQSLVSKVVHSVIG
jgi:hypothetical protein